MGSQGEVYNILGVKVPVTFKEEPAKTEYGNYKQNSECSFNLNGFTIGWGDDADYSCWMNFSYGKADLSKELSLVTPILGYCPEYGLIGEGDEAVVGIVLAAEIYAGGEQELPSFKEIETVKPRVVQLIKEKLKIDTTEEDLQLYLFWYR